MGGLVSPHLCPVLVQHSLPAPRPRIASPLPRTHGILGRRFVLVENPLLAQYAVLVQYSLLVK